MAFRVVLVCVDTGIVRVLSPAFQSFYFSLFTRTFNKQDQIEYGCFGEFCLKIMESSIDQEGKWRWLRS